MSASAAFFMLTVDHWWQSSVFHGGNTPQVIGLSAITFFVAFLLFGPITKELTFSIKSKWLIGAALGASCTVAVFCACAIPLIFWASFRAASQEPSLQNVLLAPAISVVILLFAAFSVLLPAMPYGIVGGYTSFIILKLFEKK
jgi:hypothetical protein